MVRIEANFLNVLNPHPCIDAKELNTICFSFKFILGFNHFYLFFQPERIDPRGDISRYDVRSDVWSFGISMIEISTGEFPYHSWKTPFEQLHQVVMEAPPKLPPNQFTPDFEDFINRT